MQKIAKVVRGLQGQKINKYPLQLWDFFSLFPIPFQSETLKLLLFKTGFSCVSPSSVHVPRGRSLERLC